MTEIVPFATRLAEAVRRTGTPLMVGLDPRFDLLPHALQQAHLREGRADWAAVAEAFRVFCREVIDVVAPLVPIVKPQAAFFELCGPPGMAALAEVIAHARAQGLLVVLDGKRNDIGSTAEAYADAYLGERSAWGADALTVSPYLGEDSLEPFLHTAERRGAGIFTLVKTSNPGGGFLQDVLVDGLPLYTRVADLLERWNSDRRDAHGYGPCGAVIGATYPRQLEELRARIPSAWILVPGFGAQGGTAADTAAAFAPDGLGAVVNSSRGILFAHRRKDLAERFPEDRWQEAVEFAAREAIAQLAAETPAGRLRP